jgi:DNA adenine methylase
MAKTVQKVKTASPQRSGIRPFLKWVGGKTQLLDDLLASAPKEYGTYHEPFVGGGALFFALAPKNAVLSDVNSELISAYTVVRDEPEALIDALQKHVYDKDHYYSVREWDRGADYAERNGVEKAARLIYLNKTCFNGLYRVNAQGHFNVPIGDYKNPTICDSETIRSCSSVLASAEIQCAPFSKVLERVHVDDLVYFDPPYVPVSDTASFTKYARDDFGLDQQKDLTAVCRELDRRGVKFMLSNSRTDTVEKLYQGFHQRIVQALRAVNSKASKRGAVEELLITNY